MELHQLRYALAVVDHGTFTAAADACFVAQPSLSHAVRGLEQELGTPLFHRLGRRVTLTAAGEAFVPAAREVLRALETVGAGVAAVIGMDAGHLDLVALPTLAVDPITPLVGAFRTAHPGVTVRLAHPEDTRELVELVRSGSSEIGVTELPVAAERIATVPIGRQELVAILPPGSPRPRRLALAALARHPLVTQRRGTSTRDALEAALAVIGAEATIAVETDQREAIVPLVLAGAGAAVVPRPMATLARRDGAVVAPLEPPLWRRLGLIHRDAPLSPAAQAFVDLTGARRRAGEGADPPS
jgi:LysR family transcriptional regulator, carnitine catabolism transcriptional activator